MKSLRIALTKGRLEKALECAEKYPNALVMCTGGGTASGNPDATEAGQMCRWLEEHGISSDRLIAEASQTKDEEKYRDSLEKAGKIEDLRRQHLRAFILHGGGVGFCC